MTARFRKLLTVLGDTFWLLPGGMVVGGILLGVGLVAVDRSGAVPQWLIESPWLYNGGGTGARTLLGAVASSTIGVAGTVFSITIAALSLAAGQMGPRLLRNFTRDRGNQLTLGAFLGTFSYALMVLRAVRTHSEGEFVPHLSLSVAILLAFVCVATLVFFVGHMAGRINVDTVIELVSEDVRRAISRLMHASTPACTATPSDLARRTPVTTHGAATCSSSTTTAWRLGGGTRHRAPPAGAPRRLRVSRCRHRRDDAAGGGRRGGDPRRDGGRRRSGSAPATWNTPSASWSRSRCGRCRPASTTRTRR